MNSNSASNLLLSPLPHPPPPDQVQVTYSRSSGPGGQNVNRINTKVDLRFHLASADWLSPELKEKVAAKVLLGGT